MKKNIDIQILTPTGFQQFEGIKKIKKSSYMVLLLSNGNTIKCSTNHIFISNNKYMYAHELQITDYLDNISMNKVYISDIILYNDEIELYDIIGVENGHLFIIDNDIISHNCDASFISSGNTVIEMEILQYYKQHIIKNPIEKRGVDRNLWIWEQSQFGRDYIVSADVSRGDGNDYSAFQVLDVETMDQVAEYKGKIDTKAYGNMLVSIATEYNDAVLVIENASVGWSTVQQAIDRGYRNLFYTEDDMKYIDPQKKSSNRYRQQDRKQVAGFTTSVRTRPLIISKMEEYFNNQSVNIYSERAIDELTTFIWNVNRAEAMKGYNDDIVMSLAIGLWVRDTALQLRFRNIQLQKNAIDNIIITGPMEPIYLPGQGPGDDWKMDVGTQQHEDLNWLI